MVIVIIMYNNMYAYDNYLLHNVYVDCFGACAVVAKLPTSGIEEERIRKNPWKSILVL